LVGLLEEKKKMLEEISIYEVKEGLKMVLEGMLEFAEGSEIVGFGIMASLGLRYCLNSLQGGMKRE